MPRKPPPGLQSQLVDVPFPLEGMDITRAFMRQRQLTCVQAMNVRAFEPGTDRARGGSRPGLVKYAVGPVAAIQDITVFVSEGAVAGGIVAAGPGIPGTSTNTVVVANPGSQLTTVGGTVSLNNSATDTISSPAFVWTAQGLPAGLAINASSGKITGTTSVVQSCTVVITATDHQGSFGTATFTWIVATSVSARTQYIAFASGGNVNVVNGTGYTQIGTGISASAAVVFAAPLQQQLFYCDGLSYKFFAPWANNIQTLTPVQGVLPVDSAGNTCTLIETWNGRLVLSGLLKDPANWFMSAQLNPFNFDYSPPTQVATQAVAGNDSPAGTLGDTVRCLVPYNDQILVFGCSHSIWQLTGDPMNGGQLTVVSKQLGMQWGRPYCIDPLGQVYFVGSDRGIYKLVPGSLPVWMSQPISRLLQNLAPYNPQAPANNQVIFRLVWDMYNRGLWVFATPLAAGATPTHFFWEERTNAWWPQQFANSSHDPLSAIAAGLDAADQQVLLLGGRDGTIRYFSDTAPNDDGTAITSSAMIGPIGTKRQLDNAEGILFKRAIVTLGDDSGQVNWSLYSGPTVETALNAIKPAASGTWLPGRNPVIEARSAGFYHYLLLATSFPWTVERITAEVATLGRIWQRSLMAPPTQAVATATISATPNPVTNPAGAPVTVTWDSSGGVSATLNGRPVALNGSQTFAQTLTTTYTLVVTGGAGGLVSASAFVPVAPAALSLTMSPPVIPFFGAPMTFTLASTNGVSATWSLTNANGFQWSSYAVPLNGSWLELRIVPNEGPFPLTATVTITGAPGTPAATISIQLPFGSQALIVQSKPGEGWIKRSRRIVKRRGGTFGPVGASFGGG